MRGILPKALRASADALAAFLNAEGQDVSFVDNATTGCNAVLRSLDLKPGDEILLHGQAYGAVANTARYVAERSGARVVVAELPFPEANLMGFAGRFVAGLTARTRIAIIDHVTSPSALVLPVAEIARACREAGVPLLVDGAHGPGQVEVDLTRDRRRLLCRQLPQMAGRPEGLRLPLDAPRPAGRPAPDHDLARLPGRLPRRVRLDRHARRHRPARHRGGARLPRAPRRHGAAPAQHRPRPPGRRTARRAPRQRLSAMPGTRRPWPWSGCRSRPAPSPRTAPPRCAAACSTNSPPMRRSTPIRAASGCASRPMPTTRSATTRCSPSICRKLVKTV